MLSHIALTQLLQVHYRVNRFRLRINQNITLVKHTRYDEDSIPYHMSALDADSASSDFKFNTECLCRGYIITSF